MNDIDVRERAAMNIVGRALDKYCNPLTSLGLRVEGPTLTVCDPDLSSYTSEIRIGILDAASNDIIDFLEFFVFENNAYISNERTLMSWLDNCLDEIIRERSKSMGLD